MSNGLELYRKHRPTKLSEIVGQSAAVKTLEGLIAKKRVPHAILFTGPPGTGKNTISRILHRLLGVNKNDYKEIDCPAVESAIDEVRAVQKNMRKSGMGGKYRMYVFDEVQSLSRAQFAQQALLRMLEETPSHVYFILCTTDGPKVIDAVKSRCTTINLRPIKPADLQTAIDRVCKAEGVSPSKKVIAKIVNTSGGSARTALVKLQQALSVDGEQQQLDAVEEEMRSEAFDLVKALMPFEGRPTWENTRDLLKALRDEDPEKLRQMILATATTHLLNGNKLARRALEVIQCFRDDNLYDSKPAKFAAVVANCFEILGGKS